MSILTFETCEPGERFRERLGEPERGAALADPAPETLPPGVAGLIARRGGQPVARCTLGVARDLMGAPGVTGLIGHYQAADGAAGAELLAAACAALSERGVARVLGPMNGSTWKRYRLMLPPEPGDPPPDPAFAGEPLNPLDYPEHFTKAGFTVAAHYQTRIDERVAGALLDPPLPERVAGRGIRARTLDPERFDQDLEQLFELSRTAFAANLYYTPIEWAEFRALYQPVRPLVDPELVTLAHDAAGRLAGFMFAFPDPLALEDGRSTRVVMKTIAVAAEHRGLGLGDWFFDRTRARARERGAKAVLHALMFADNVSMRQSLRHESRLMRRYALYQWMPR